MERDNYSSARQLEVEVELEALLVTLCAALKPTVAMSTVVMVAMKRIVSTRFGREKTR